MMSDEPIRRMGGSRWSPLVARHVPEPRSTCGRLALRVASARCALRGDAGSISPIGDVSHRRWWRQRGDSTQGCVAASHGPMAESRRDGGAALFVGWARWLPLHGSVLYTARRGDANILRSSREAPSRGIAVWRECRAHGCGGRSGGDHRMRGTAREESCRPATRLSTGLGGDHHAGSRSLGGTILLHHRASTNDPIPDAPRAPRGGEKRDDGGTITPCASRR